MCKYAAPLYTILKKAAMKFPTELKDLLQDLKSLDERYETDVHSMFIEELNQGIEDDLEPDEIQELLKDHQHYMESEEIFQDDEQRRVVSEIVSRLPILLRV